MSVCSRWAGAAGAEKGEGKEGGASAGCRREGLWRAGGVRRSNQEKGRFEGLSDFLLPLLCSGHKLI